MCSINHNLKAIFIHIPKNGGSYISEILSKNYIHVKIKKLKYLFSLCLKIR